MDYSLLVGVDKARGELVVGVIDYCRQVGCRWIAAVPGRFGWGMWVQQWGAFSKGGLIVDAQGWFGFCGPVHRTCEHTGT